MPADEQVHAHAQAVALALGDGWKYVEHEDPKRRSWFALIRRGDGPAELHVSQRDGRVWWSVNYPRDVNGYEHAPRDSEGGRLSISTSAAKDPAATARDIARRLIAPYLLQLEKCQESAQRTNDYEAKCQSGVARLLTIPGMKARKNGPERGHIVDFYDEARGYGDVQVNGDTVQMDIRSIPIERAAEILALILAER